MNLAVRKRGEAFPEEERVGQAQRHAGLRGLLNRKGRAADSGELSGDVTALLNLDSVSAVYQAFG